MYNVHGPGLKINSYYQNDSNHQVNMAHMVHIVHINIYHQNDSKTQVYMGTGCPEEANVGRSVTMQSISSSLR